MTFKDWWENNPQVVGLKRSNGGIQVFTADLQSDDAKWDLYHLDDYAVDAALSGPSVWLRPREATETK